MYYCHVTFVAAYLNRKDYNVFTVDWEPLTFFPCYLSSLSNTRLVAQCTAQFYAHLTYSGASAYDIHCVGHSLGAHICGMISNHLTHRQHKIIGMYIHVYIYILHTCHIFYKLNLLRGNFICTFNYKIIAKTIFNFTH